MKTFLALTILFFSYSLTAASSAGQNSLETLKMEKRFGIGVVAGGPLSIFGIEIDINISEDFSLSGGIGTGIDYSTLALKGRYYLLGRSVSPYVGFGVARWWADSLKSADLAPALVSNNFLGDGFKPEDGLNLFLLYPVLGVQYLHPMGIEFSAEVMYLFKLLNFANAAYAGVGVHWYF